MAEVTYTDVTWTAGDIITEAKMDNMVANDRAVDSMNNGIRMTERADPATPPANTLHLYAKDNSGVSALFYIDDSGYVAKISEPQAVFTFPFPGPLLTGTSVTSTLIVHRALTIIKAYAYCKTGPVGAAAIFDIKKNGVSIWASTPANRVTIADGSQEGTQTAFDTTALVEDDKLTLDIVQLGSTTTGSDLTVELKAK